MNKINKESITGIRSRTAIHYSYKLLSSLLTCVLLLTSITGCTLTKDSPKAPQISSDDQWYSYSAFDMKSDYKDSSNPANYYYAENWALGTYNNEFINLVRVSSDDESEKVTLLEFYDNNGNKTKTIDIDSLIKNYEEYGLVM